MIKKPWLWPVICLVLIAGTGSFGVAAADTDNNENTRGQLEKIKAEIDKLQDTLKQFKDERSRLQGDLRKSEVDISESQKKIRQIAEIEETQKHLPSSYRQPACSAITDFLSRYFASLGATIKKCL